MIENYITETDLEKIYPKIYSLFYVDNLNFVPYVDRGFKKVHNDLYNAGQDLKKLMPKLDLLRSDSTASGDGLVSESITATYTGDEYVGGHQLRFVVYASACSGTWTATLQGSNQATPTVWEDVTSLEIDTTGTESITFLREYLYYRVIVNGGTSLSFNCYLVETTFDDLICYATWATIFSDHNMNVNDIYGEWKKGALEMYKNMLSNQKFSVDDGDFTADSDDTTKKIDVRFAR